MKNKNIVCSICGTNQISLKDAHAFKLVVCDKCQHSYLLIDENKSEKLAKTLLKKQSLEQTRNGILQNVFEFSFCPYWALLKLLKDTTAFRIRFNEKPEKVVQLQYFSETSVKLFATSIGLPNKTTLEGNVLTQILNH